MFTRLTPEHLQPKNLHKTKILASHILHHLLRTNKPSGIYEFDEKNLEQMQHASLVMASAAFTCYENGKKDIFLYQRNHVFCLVRRETLDTLVDGENALFLDIIVSCIDAFFAENENDMPCDACGKQDCTCGE